MKIVEIIVAFVLAIVVCNVSNATQIVAITELDRALFVPGGKLKDEVKNFMTTHRLDDLQMITLLEENIKTHLDNKDKPGHIECIESTLTAIRHIEGDNAISALQRYIDPKLPEYVPSQALTLYLLRTKLDGLSVATNVMLNPEFGWRERNQIRIEYVAQAKNANLENREKYLDFLKWASMYYGGGFFPSLDAGIISLDPSWRSNDLRRANIERLFALAPPPAGTNVLNNILKDYEQATGIIPAQDFETKAPVPTEVTNAVPDNTSNPVQKANGIKDDRPPLKTNSSNPGVSWARLALVSIPLVVVFAVLMRKKK